VIDELYQVAEVLFDASSTQEHPGGFVEDGVAAFDFQFGVAEGRRRFALVLQRKLSRCRRVPHQKGTRSVTTSHVLLPYLRSYRIAMEPFLSHNWRNLNQNQSPSDKKNKKEEPLRFYLLKRGTKRAELVLETVKRNAFDGGVEQAEYKVGSMQNGCF